MNRQPIPTLVCECGATLTPINVLWDTAIAPKGRPAIYLGKIRVEMNCPNMDHQDSHTVQVAVL